MSVQVEPPPLAVVEEASSLNHQVPALWPQLDPLQQKHLAHCWAQLIHRIRRPAGTVREAGHDAGQ